ncbi:hypothetical protein A2881_03180 [Candidatus Peribacteria bacterium RIFCSPHIGHO2_01_FULL_55_13]|nr:MAG: hypothetical protein A2881_03180 [Candidatus Peribacteria bacterium RIFCSPHIGHO2_01_FULL_55_13]OGJ65988.1 MAG: hypothetical protein A3F36_04735 [Candidatus Peribacteria bacterium RIFCSPHIGHO2_12_FULL_55_11]
MIRLKILTIDDEVAGAEPRQKAPGSFEGALRLSRQREAHKESMSYVLRIRTVQELSAVEASDEEEREAAVEHDATLSARAGVNSITPYFYDDIAKQFDGPDPQPTQRRQGVGE